MSYPELIHWNPMEEEFKRNFCEKNNNDLNLLCLYVTKIPNHVTKDYLLSLMLDGGRNVTGIMLKEQLPSTSGYTFGFVHFDTHEDAYSALMQFNGTPPLYLKVAFAHKERKDKRVEREDNFNQQKARSAPRGRGIRINLEDSPNTQKLKVITGDRRTVIIGSPTKRPVSALLQTPKSLPVQKVESSKSQHTSIITPQESGCKEMDIPISLGPNPFYFCFKCGKDGRFACENCKKPYCSRNCQNADWRSHQYSCKSLKVASASLIQSYNNSQSKSNDSSYVSENSNSEHEKFIGSTPVNVRMKRFSKNHEEACKDVEKLLLSPGQVEKVLVVNIVSPSKFWAQLKTFSDDFLKMEKEFSSLQKKSPLPNVSCAKNLNCCTVLDNKIYRTTILKEKSPNEVLAYLIDYGKTLTVPKNALYHLPKEFRMLPAQAVCCKLVDEAKKEDIDWSNEDLVSFQLHTSNKIYKAHILKCIDNIYEISLINEDGITLFSILAEEKNTMSCVSEELQVAENDGIPPSIWSKLKPGSQMTLVPSIVNEGSIWCYLSANGGTDLGEILDTEKLLQGYSGKDITVCAEEGDFAAGFSTEYQQFYRCMVLSRKRVGFCVRYIDYGNEEEITRLCTLSEELQKKFSYTVRCEKPAPLSLSDFQKFVGNSAKVTVIKVDKDVAELSFNFGKKYIMLCYPCYPSFSDNHPIDVPKEPQLISPKVNISHVSDSEVAYKSELKNEAKPKICEAMDLSLNTTYNVKIVFIKTVSEVYVQLAADENKIKNLFTNLSTYCNSRSTRYVPTIGEVVCCKFSDQKWYRGQVLEKVGEQYRIFFLDYGNEGVLSLSDLQVLPSTFVHPKLAVCVSMSGIKNEDLTESLISRLLNESWNMKVINKKIPFEVMLFQKNCSLSSMIAENTSNKKNKKALKFQKLPTDISIDIKVSYEDKNFMYLHQIKDLKSLEQLAIKLNSLSDLSVPKKPAVNNVYCGLCSDGLWYRVSIEEEVSHNTFKVFFFDYGNYETVSCNNLRDLPSDLFALPVYCVPVVVQNRGKLKLIAEEQYAIKVNGMNGNTQEVTFLQNSDKESSIINTKQMRNSDKMSKFALKFQKLPSDVSIDIKVSYEDKNFVYVHQVKDGKSLEELAIKLNTLPKLLVPKKPVINNVYCGLFTDGLWYRVSIEEEVSCDMFKVFFLDYGNYENVSCNNLRDLPSDLFALPVYCIPVIVENREKVKLIAEEHYTVKVNGMKGNTQEVTFLQNSDKESSTINIKEMTNGDKMSKFALKFQKLPSDVSIDVKVSYEDKNFLYVHQVNDVKSLEELVIKLNTLPELPVPKKPIINNVYCGLFTDGLWYRVSIEEEVSCDMFKVFFLDYGNYENVSCNNLRDLPSYLFALPVYCIPVIVENREKVKLIAEEHYTVKVNGMKGNTQEVTFLQNSDKESSTINIKEMTNGDKMSKFALKFQKLPSDVSIDVKVSYEDKNFLYVHQVNDIKSLEELVIKLNTLPELPVPKKPIINNVYCGLFTDGLWYRVSIEEEVSCDMFKVFFLDYGNYENVSCNNLRDLPSDLFALPVYCIPVIVQNREKVKLIAEEHYTVKVNGMKGNTQEVTFLQNSDKESSTINIKEMTNGDKMSKFALKFQKLPSDVSIDVKVSYEDKNFLYVHQVNDVKSLEELVIKLNTLPELPVPKKPVINNVYCGLFTDGLWYRVSIEEEVSCDMFKVFFLDYGNYENVSCNNLRDLPSDLFALPVYCIPVIVENREKVKLIAEEHYTVKVNGMKGNTQEVTFLQNSDKESSTINIKEMTNGDKMSKFALKFQKLPSDVSIDVKVSYEDKNFLYVHQVNDVKSLEELVIKLNTLPELPVPKKPVINNVYCGLFTDGLWYRVSVEEEVSCDMFKVFFLDYGNYENVSCNNLRDLPSDLFALPVYCIPVIVENREKVKLIAEEKYTVEVNGMKGNTQEVTFLQNSDKESSTINIKEMTNGDKMSKFALKFQKLPSDVSIDVKVSYEDKKFLYVHQVNDVKSLEELVIKLNTLPELPVPKKPVINDVYCGLFTDGLWYRVSVEEEVSCDMFKVFFLDYGNYENVSCSNLRDLPRDLFALPVYCIPVVVQYRENLNLIMEEHYSVRVTGINGKVQEVKFLLDLKHDNIKNIDDNETRSKRNKSDLKFLKLPVEIPVDIIIIHEDKNFVYMHQITDLKSLEQLSIKLNSLSELPVPKKPVINNVYCGLCSDGFWYRVSIEEEVSCNMFKVFFLDFGNYENVSCKDLRELPHDLFALPVYCVPVVVQKRDELSLTTTEQYSVRVTGMNGEVQEVKFLLDMKQDCISDVSETNNKLNKSPLKLQTLPVDVTVETAQLPNISSLKKQHLEDGLNEIIITCFCNEINHCQLSFDNDNVLNMFKSLQKCSKGKPPAVLSVGNVICAQSADGCWYRASIVCDKKAPSYKVFFIDYGNTETITYDCIKLLPKNLLEPPIFAIPIKIENVKDINDPDFFTQSISVKKIRVLDGNLHIVKAVVESDMVLPKISIFEREKLPSNVISKITNCLLENDIFYVQLVSNQDKLEKLAGALMKAETFCDWLQLPAVDDVICVKSSNGIWYRGVVEEIYSEKNLMKVSFIDCGNSDTISLENIKILPSELCSYPIFSIPIKFKNVEFVMKNLSQEIRTFDVIVSGVDNDIQVVDIASEVVKEKEKLEGNKEVANVEPSSNEIVGKSNECKIFTFSSCKTIPFEAGEQDIVIYSVEEGFVFCAPYDKESIRANIELSRELAEYCPHQGIEFVNGCEPECEELVLAQYSEDGKWYRAIVLEKSPPLYVVHFIDYGNSENLDISRMRQMEKQFLTPDVSTHLCRLTGFKPKDENYTKIDEEIKNFTIFSHPEPLRAIIHVKEYVTANIPIITSWLVEKNLAEASDES